MYPDLMKPNAIFEKTMELFPGQYASGSQTVFPEALSFSKGTLEAPAKANVF